MLNKIDRLILEWKQTPEEAFERLSQILEQVNAILGEFEAQELLEEAEILQQQQDQQTDTELAAAEAEDGADELKEPKKDFYFAPEKGNVIFASAIDGWAFRTNDFAAIYATKLGMKDLSLNRFLWGKYYLDPKTKRVIGPKGLKGRNLKPMFVQFCLDNIWRVYESTVLQPDTTLVEKIVKSLGIKVTPWELKTKEVRTLLQTIMTQWLPLAKSILIAVVQKIPSPKEAQSYRMEPILMGSSSDSPERQAVDQAIVSCDSSEDAPVVAFMSKIFSVSSKELPASQQDRARNEEMVQEMRRLAIARSKARASAREGNDAGGSDVALPHIPSYDPPSSVTANAGSSSDQQNTAPNSDEVFIGFARIYSGRMKVGQTIKVLGPKYNAAAPNREEYMTEMQVERLFLLMGKDLQDLDSVVAGNVFGILLNDEHIFKTATLVSTDQCASLAGIRMDTPPILRVALEPTVPTQL